MFDYNGRAVVLDPRVALGHLTFGKGDALVRVKVPERTDEWFYEGHPCESYLANVPGCSAIEDYGMGCGPCREVGRAPRFEDT